MVIQPVNFQAGLKTGYGFLWLQGINFPAEVSQIQGYSSGNIFYGQVTFNRIVIPLGMLDLFALKNYQGVFLYIKKLIGTEMIVSFALIGIDASCFNLKDHFAFFKIVGIKVKRS